MERRRPRAPVARHARTLALLLLAWALGCRPAPEEEVAATVPAPAAGQPAPSGPLTLYSSRREELVAPLLERFERESGVDLDVRYGESGELAAALMEAGVSTPADLFLSRDAAALGALSRKGLLRELPMELARRVPAHFAGTEQRHDWMGLSGRARAVVYSPARLRPELLPQSLVEASDGKWRGRFALAPGGAFEAHMAAYRVLHGEEELDRLLASLHANEPRLYPSDAAVVQAVARGEVDWGLVDHSAPAVLASRQPDAGAAAVASFFMPGGDGSGFVDVAGVGVLSDDPRALELVRFLLGEEAQDWFAEQTYEYPLARDAPPAPELPPLSGLGAPRLDFADVAAVLGETSRALRRHGLAS